MSVPSSVIILAYHRIATPASQPELAPTLIDAYPSDFEAQMRFLAARYNVVSSWDLVRALRDGHTLPRRALVITFDDGYRCFKETAWPILSRLGLPVTLFVPTHYPSHPTELFWWDTLHRALVLTPKRSLEIRNVASVQDTANRGVAALPLRPYGRTSSVPSPDAAVQTISLATPVERDVAFHNLVNTIERLNEGAAKCLLDSVLAKCAVPSNSTTNMLNWGELAELAAEGVSMGPHTRNHTILSQLTPERARDEVAWSWSDLQERIPDPVPIFCYPNGKPHAISRTGIDAVRHSGMVGGVTMVAGLNRVGRTNPYLMYRVGAVAGESLRHFSLKISLAGRVYRRLKKVVRGKGEVFHP